MRQVQLSDFLTEAEIAQAIGLYQTCAPGTFVRRVTAEILEPNLPRINQQLGQENDARYLAYVVEYVLRQASK